MLCLWFGPSVTPECSQYSARIWACALASFGLRKHQKQPAVILGLGLVVIPFIPASNLFFLVGTTIGERLLYPSSVGFVLLVAGLGRATGIEQRIYKGLLIVLLLIYMWNSNIRMSHWSSSSALFETDAKYWSRSTKVLHSKASELQARNDLHGALDYYLKSLEVFDDQAITDYCIARVLINFDRLEEAYQRFEKILNGHGIGLHDGNDFLWMTDLGYLLVKTGNFQGGVHYLNEGLARWPHSCFAWNALGVGQAHLGQFENAYQSLVRGLECDYDSVGIWINLAVVLAYSTNDVRQTGEALARAQALNNTHPAVVHNALVLQGQLNQQPVFHLYIPLPGRR